MPSDASCVTSALRPALDARTVPRAPARQQQQRPVSARGQRRGARPTGYLVACTSGSADVLPSWLFFWKLL